MKAPLLFLPVTMAALLLEKPVCAVKVGRILVMVPPGEGKLL